MRAGVLVAFAIGCRAATPAGAPAPTPATEVHVDRRVELVATLAWLAGYPEYDLASPSPYVREVKAHFGRFADHPAVAATRALAAEHDISHDAPMAFAIHLDAQLFPQDVEDLAVVSDRWRGVDVAAYAALVRDFARASDFDGFFAAHRAYYAQLEDVVRGMVDAERPSAWFSARFGQPEARFTVVPGPQISAFNYGVRANHAGGTLEMAQVLAVWQPDGLPTFDDDTVAVLIHEMAHSYINPVFDRHAAALAPAGAVLFPLVARRLRNQGYDDWLNVARESGVRATVEVFFRERKGAVAAAREDWFQRHQGFPWIAALADVVQRIPPGSLEAKMPDLVAAFDALAVRYAHGLPRGRFEGPIDAVLVGDPVFVAPADDAAAALVARLRDRVSPGAPLAAASADPLAAHPGKDLVLYGAPTDAAIAGVLARGGWTVDASGIRIAGRQFTGPHLVLIVCAPRPDDPDHGIVVYTAPDLADLGDMAAPHGLSDWSVKRRTAEGYERVDGDNFGPPP